MSDTSKKAPVRISPARKKLLAGYAEAAGRLYGALSISEFVGVFNYYERKKTDEQEAVPVLLRYKELHPLDVYYTVYNEYITGPELVPGFYEEDIGNLRLLRAKQEGKPRYLPDEKQEFLKYSGANHREPEKPYEELKAYIINNGLFDNVEVDDYDVVEGGLIDLHNMIKKRAEMIEIIEYFTESGYEFSGADQLNAFTQVVMTAQNNTRLHENNGHTQDELNKDQHSFNL